MAKSARLPIVVVATAATLMASPAFAASSAVTAATAKVQLTRPLMLTATQNLDFGTVLLSAVVAGNTYTVRLVPNGALTCSSGVTCAATGKPAIFNVQMSNNQNGQGNGQNGQGNGQNGQGNNQKIYIHVAASSFTNGITTLQITPNLSANFVLLSSSGAPGADFPVGASFPITSATTEGIYTGTLNVTVDFN
jgi:hypothetical protein